MDLSDSSSAVAVLGSMAQMTQMANWGSDLALTPPPRASTSHGHVVKGGAKGARSPSLVVQAGGNSMNGLQVTLATHYILYPT